MGKKKVVPKLKLLIDSREQLPLDFDEGVFDDIRVQGMPVGDYWAELDGKEVPLCFERKSLADLFGTMGKGYPRFKKEMARAKEAGLTMILMIEGSMREVAAGHEYSRMEGRTMLKKLAMLRVRYDLEFHFFNDRREMSRYIEEVFSAVKRNWSGDVVVAGSVGG